MAPANADSMIRVFANILVDEGYLRSAMLDLQRESYALIPKDLGEAIDELRTRGRIDLDELDPTWRVFLQQHEVTFQCDEQDTEQFTQLDLDWKCASPISNCVVEFKRSDSEFHTRVESLLQECGCTRLLLISPDPISTSDLRALLSIYGRSILRSIDVISRFYLVNEQDLSALVQEHPRLRSWVLCGAPSECMQHSGVAGFGQVVSYLDVPNIYSDDSLVDPAYFKSNITLYSESQKWHTYFNAKLFVRSDGAILNAPNSTEIIGSIFSSAPGAVRKLVRDPQLTRWWSVAKHNTDVCKDCEFRNMCVDSRPPLMRTASAHYHAGECNYNPYICKWKGEKGYRNLADCGVVSNAERFSIDHDRIAAINAELWGE